MIRATIAGAIYFGIVFAFGFAFGTIRVLVLVPRFGTLAAVLAELPLIVTVSWLTCQRLIKWFSVPRCVLPRLMMGGAAFAILMLAEAGLSVVAFRQPVSAFVAGWATLPGALGLAGQVAFGFFPLILSRSPTVGRAA